LSTNYFNIISISDVANSTVRFDEKGDGLARYTIYNYQKDEDSNTTDYKVIDVYETGINIRLDLKI
jgi:hypothetical protein